MFEDSIVLLCAQFDDGYPDQQGTAWLASRGMLLTAAHCLAPYSSLRTVTLRDSLTLDKTPAEGQQRLDVTFAPASAGDADLADLAAIVLPPGTFEGVPPIAPDPGLTLRVGDAVAVVGYDAGTDQPAWRTGTVGGGAAPGLLRYDVPTVDGDSGGPVLVQRQGAYRAVGVHQRADPDGHGVALTGPLLADLGIPLSVA